MSSARHTLVTALAVVCCCADGVSAQQPPARKPPVSKPPVTTPVTTPATKPAPTPAAATANAPASAPPTSPKSSAGQEWRWTRVTYLSGDLVYLDAGSLAGLREKSTAEVIRKDSAVTRLEVQFVSSASAAARVMQGSAVVVGDSVRFAPPVINTLASSGATATARGADSLNAGITPPPARRPNAPRAVSGRIGLRYLSLETGAGANGRLTQPAIDLRLEGHRMDGSPLGIVIDARAHRQRSGDGRTIGSTRVYQSLLEYQSANTFPLRVTVGRQISNTLSPIGFFDGLSIESDHRHWRVGALGGTQPDYTNFQPSGAIREGGAFVQWHNATGTGSLFQTTLGGVGSYTPDGVNREFALLSTIMVTPTVSLYATQELDINRGWKRSAESGRSITPTSLFATMRVSVNRAVAINGGYDSRRSVRLYRDFLTPDIAFDDALRRGYWGGISVNAPHLYMSADMRTSDGMTVGRNNSSTATVSVTRLTPLGLGVRARGTSYSGPSVTGTLMSASVEANPMGRLRVEATMGKRNDQHASNNMIPAQTTWVGFDADAGIGRSWYLMASTYREVGVSDRLLQQYVALSWRF